jgi:hypothetical protein
MDKFEVGQEVYDVACGKGVVECLNDGIYDYIIVKFNDRLYESYTTNGIKNYFDKRPSLFHQDPRVVGFEEAEKKPVKNILNEDWCKNVVYMGMFNRRIVFGEYSYIAIDKSGALCVFGREPKKNNIEKVWHESPYRIIFNFNKNFEDWKHYISKIDWQDYDKWLEENNLTEFASNYGGK